MTCPNKVLRIVTIAHINSCKYGAFFLAQYYVMKMIRYCILNELYVNFRIFLIDIA
jgi:hypothetical protein